MTHKENSSEYVSTSKKNTVTNHNNDHITNGGLNSLASNTIIVKKGEDMHNELNKQRDFTKNITKKNFGLVLVDSFVKGMREIGYTSSATAINELIDNAIQSGASSLEIIAKTTKGSDNKPEAIAFKDNGHGMDPDMIRVAGMWGGTHRESYGKPIGRKGFGRFGYGLPSASLSQCRSFTIYSKTSDGELNKVTIDTDALINGDYNDDNGHPVVPKAQSAQLPDWIGNLDFGTVIVWEKIDRLFPKTISGFIQSFAPVFGTTYWRNIQSGLKILLFGKIIDAIDPLFQSQGLKGYNSIGENNISKAEVFDPIICPVKISQNVNGAVETAIEDIEIRISYLDPSFPRLNPKDSLVKENTDDVRWNSMRERRGFIVSREGREISVVNSVPARIKWQHRTFQNYDRYWQIEINFPACLDEEFSVNTNKQRLVISERIWNILRESGLDRITADLYAKAKKGLAADNIEAENKDGNTSTSIMNELAETTRTRPFKQVDEIVARENLEEVIKLEAQKSRKSLEEAKTIVEAELNENRYSISYESMGMHSPFFDVKPLGEKNLNLTINKDHIFFTDMYSIADKELKTSIELILYVIGQAKSTASEENQILYQNEMYEWSKLLTNAIGIFNKKKDEKPADKLAAIIQDKEESLN